MLLVSATPYNVLSQKSRVPDFHVIDWTEAQKQHLIKTSTPFHLRLVDKYTDGDVFLGASDS